VHPVGQAEFAQQVTDVTFHGALSQV